jgi:hypothetical protein
MQSLAIEIDAISNKIQVFNQSAHEVSLPENAVVGPVVFRFDVSRNINGKII